jgi:hypothetical protein
MKKLTQQWIVVTDERGSSLLVSHWVRVPEFGTDRKPVV